MLEAVSFVSSIGFFQKIQYRARDHPSGKERYTITHRFEHSGEGQIGSKLEFPRQRLYRQGFGNVNSSRLIWVKMNLVISVTSSRGVAPAMKSLKGLLAVVTLGNCQKSMKACPGFEAMPCVWMVPNAVSLEPRLNRQL